MPRAAWEVFDVNTYANHLQKRFGTKLAIKYRFHTFKGINTEYEIPNIFHTKLD